MLNTIHKTKPFSPFFLFLFTLFLTIHLALPWMSAEEPPKPQPWQIDGIIAALDDGHDQVKVYALGQLARYESQDLQTVVDKPEDIAQKAANILRDKTLDVSVRESAAGALGNLGEAATQYIPDIINFIQDETIDEYLTGSAISALVNLAKADAQYIPDIINFIQDETIDLYQSSYIRSLAAYALGNLGEAAAPYIPDILNFLQDETVDSDIRHSAARALENIGESGAVYAPEIANILQNETVDSNIRVWAAIALGNLGKAGAPYIPDILNFLQDETVNPFLRSLVANALRNLGEAGIQDIPDILNFLQDETVDSFLRGSVANALGNLGEADVQYIPDILNLLQDETVDSYVLESAAIALGNLGEPVTQYIPEILHFIQLDLKVVRFLVANLLVDLRRLDLNEVVYILNNADNTNQFNFEYWRFLTYFLGGGTDEVKTLLKWVGSPKSTPTALNYEDGKKTLELFLQVWDDAQDLPRLQNDLAKKIAVVTRLVSWKSQDIDLLQRHYNNLKAGNFSQADTVESVIQDLRSMKN